MERCRFPLVWLDHESDSIPLICVEIDVVLPYPISITYTPIFATPATTITSYHQSQQIYHIPLRLRQHFFSTVHSDGDFWLIWLSTKEPYTIMLCPLSSLASSCIGIVICAHLPLAHG